MAEIQMHGRPDDELGMCPRCRCCELVWEHCEDCGGTGTVEVEDFDGESDDEDCDTCGGDCGWRRCLGPCDKDGKHRPTEALS